MWINAFTEAVRIGTNASYVKNDFDPLVGAWRCLFHFDALNKTVMVYVPSFTNTILDPNSDGFVDIQPVINRIISEISSKIAGEPEGKIE